MARGLRDRLWASEPLCHMENSVYVILHVYLFLGQRPVLSTGPQGALPGLGISLSPRHLEIPLEPTAQAWAWPRPSLARSAGLFTHLFEWYYYLHCFVLIFRYFLFLGIWQRLV